ncbi:pentapeptide repeat-containing protein [Streptomyces sp. NPDC058001]|uniref:pentapeptide repeat-containing protein n=1 Tax=Streptomyces sp. NPDC058001 TaxID=3346300 RepID=UPI0036E3070D
MKERRALRNADLRSADLRSADLRNADLRSDLRAVVRPPGAGGRGLSIRPCRPPTDPHRTGCPW